VVAGGKNKWVGDDNRAPAGARIGDVGRVTDISRAVTAVVGILHVDHGDAGQVRGRQVEELYGRVTCGHDRRYLSGVALPQVHVIVANVDGRDPVLQQLDAGAESPGANLVVRGRATG